MSQLVSQTSLGAKWLTDKFTEDPCILAELLIEHSNGEVREQFGALLKTLIKQASITAEFTIEGLVEQLCILFTKSVKHQDDYCEVIKEYVNSFRASAIQKLTSG